MILSRCYINGFGKLSDCSLNFQPGLNLVFAQNEGGKTTLQRFLAALLYGQLRSDLRMQRRVDPWVEQYKPWTGSYYGGILWIRLKDGREMEIHRTFGKDETRIEIRSATGEDITNQYEQQRNGEVLFARSYFGMAKDLFESVGIIRENKAGEIGGHDTIRDRIANLAQSGDEDLSLPQSIARLQQALESIGSERAPTRPYKQAMDLIQSLQSERKELEERRIQFQGWIEERSRLAREISRLENDLSRSRWITLTAHIKEAANKVEALEEIAASIRDLRVEIESLSVDKDFPAGGLEELNQLVGACESMTERLKEIRAEKESAFEELALVETERMQLDSYTQLAASSEADKTTEWFVSYLSQTLQKEGAQKTMARLASEKDVLEKNLSMLSPLLSDASTDWQHVVLEAAEDEQAASSHCMELADKIAQEGADLSMAGRNTTNWRTLTVLMFLLAAALVAGKFFLKFESLSWPSTVGLGLFFCVAAAGFMAAAVKSAEKKRVVAQTRLQLENELSRIRIESGQKRKRINQAILDSGLTSIDEFLAIAKQSEQDRRKLSELTEQISETEQLCGNLQSQCAELYENLKNSLAKVGLSCSPGNLKYQIDLLRANLRRFREIDSRYTSAIQKADSLKSEDEELTNTCNQKNSQMQSLLSQARVDSPDKFREECRKRQKLEELLDREASRNREYQSLCGDLTLEEWKDRLQKLVVQQKKEKPSDNSLTGEPRAGVQEPRLPDLPGVAEAEEEEKRVTSLLSSAREEYASAVERTTNAFLNFRSSSEIEEDLTMAEQNFRKLEINRRALEIALDTIENLSRQQQEVLAPQLNSAVEQRFLRLCGHRYEEVKIDPDFQVWVREAGVGDLRIAEQLSRGTQDQLYFAVRFGILDLLSNEDEPCPCLLDEPFAAYDRERLIKAMEILKEEAGRRQLILFTCRKDVRDLVQQQGGNIIDGLRNTAV